jgi:hypothetical protein
MNGVADSWVGRVAVVVVGKVIGFDLCWMVLYCVLLALAMTC